VEGQSNDKEARLKAQDGVGLVKEGGVLSVNLWRKVIRMGMCRLPGREKVKKTQVSGGKTLGSIMKVNP